MGKRRTIKIRGLKGKRHTQYPFFATEKDKKRLAWAKLKDKVKKDKDPTTPTSGTT